MTAKKPKKVDTSTNVSKTSKYPPSRLAGLKPVKPGQVLNPKGRAKGSRNDLAEAFISAMNADFREHGEAVIAKVREEKPADYLRVCLGIIPKEFSLKTEALEELAEDELARILAEVRARIADTVRETGGEGLPEGTRH